MYDPTPEQQAYLDELQANIDVAQKQIDNLPHEFVKEYADFKERQIATIRAYNNAIHIFKLHFCKN